MTLSLSAVLEINFEESDYSIIEGISVLSTNLTLTFRTNQNPFSVELSPVIIDAAQNLSLDSFISFDNIEPTFRATGKIIQILASSYSLSFARR